MAGACARRYLNQQTGLMIVISLNCTNSTQACGSVAISAAKSNQTVVSSADADEIRTEERGRCKCARAFCAETGGGVRGAGGGGAHAADAG